MSWNAIGMAGKRFGRLLVMARVGTLRGQVLWFCRCDCGGTIETTGHEIRKGSTRSCGCLMREHQSRLTGKRTHGQSKVNSGAYKSWVSLRNRCENPNNVDYPRYGGRGITVSDEWKTFERFREDMGERPAGYSIERKDVNGPYAAWNCEWATSKSQGRNRRNTVFIKYRGDCKTLSEWSEELGLDRTTIHKRLRNGAAPEEALAPSKRKTKRKGEEQ